MAIPQAGEKFARLTVVEVAGKNRRGETIVLCRCDCGSSTIVVPYKLKIGKAKSCGCLGTGPDVESLVGRTFHKLTVVSQAGADKGRVTKWLCKCECGQTTVVRRPALLSGKIKSCGCFAKSNTYRVRGKAHPSYNPTLTDAERQASRRTFEYLEWRRKVLRLDDYRCRGCTRRGGRLVTHHLDSFDLFTGLRTDPSNGACMCVPCHRAFHAEFGMGRNTKQQFEFWIWWRALGSV